MARRKKHKKKADPLKKEKKQKTLREMLHDPKRPVDDGGYAG